VQAPEGKVLQAVIAALGDSGTYGRSLTYTLAQWRHLLSAYFELAVYLVPPPRPDYLEALVRSVPSADMDEGIAFACLIQQTDPLLIRQCLSDRLLRTWDDHLKDRMEQLIAIGESVEYWDEDPKHITWVSRDGSHVSVSLDGYDYDIWLGESEDLATICGEFYSWAPVKAPGMLAQLQILQTMVQGPPEPDWDWDDDLSEAESADYWTIEAMFEDL
jgi:hypothetical protein